MPQALKATLDDYLGSEKEGVGPIENQNDHCVKRLMGNIKVLLCCDARLRGDNLVFGEKIIATCCGQTAFMLYPKGATLEQCFLHATLSSREGG